MSDTPLVSVIIATRNAGDALGPTLDSVLSQSYPSLECIVVDDCSTDESAARCEMRAQSEPRLRVIRQPHRHGLASGRYGGLINAGGPLVMFLEAGDVLTKDTIARRVETFRKRRAEGTPVGGVWCATISADDAGAPSHSKLHKLSASTPDVTFMDATPDASGRWRTILFEGDWIRHLGGPNLAFDDDGDLEELAYKTLRHGLVLVGGGHIGAVTPPPDPARAETRLRRMRTLARRIDRRMPASEQVEETPFLFAEARPYYLRQREHVARTVEASLSELERGRTDAATRLVGTLPSPLPHALVDVRSLVGNGTMSRAASGVLDLINARAAGGRSSAGTPDLDNPDVLFMPHNAYHTYEMSSVARELEARGYRFLFVDVTEAYRDEGSRDKMQELDLPHVRYTDDVLHRHTPGVLFVMNDWGAVVHKRVVEAKKLGIRTVALVEGVQDYEDTHVEHLGIGRMRNAYRHSDLALLVGEYDRKFFGEHETRLTGSTRIENLFREPRPTDRRPYVVINSNFTYGIYTQIQPEWIRDAVEACRLAGVDYVISQHHADVMDLSGYNRTDRPLYDELRECALVISKFSGVILEAMALDTPVIYFNPHEERVDKFLDPQGAYPMTDDPRSLADAIKDVMATPIDKIAQRQRPFFDLHVSIDPDRPTFKRIADVVEEQLSMVLV